MAEKDFERRKRLVRQALENEGEITYDQSGYKHDPNVKKPKAAATFKRDCKTIVKKARRLNEVLLEPLVLPPVRVQDGYHCLSIGPIRPFATSLSANTKLLARWQTLARRLVAHRLSADEHLVPRGDKPLFLAFGRTTFCIALELEKQPDAWGDIHTTGFEIAARVYFAARQKHGPNWKSRLFVSGCEIDFHEGTAKPSEDATEVDTAIIGFDSITHDGRVFATGDRTIIDFSKRAIRQAIRRVIFVGTADKIGRGKGGRQPKPIPWPTEKEVYLVTDDATKAVNLPPQVQLLTLSRDEDVAAVSVPTGE